ncbi:butyrophilin subfamily 1 member A1-like [Mobula birostris]|uniref:butyrophilin subfamily 1 member A1-like n=1 Tax=Mobula birostris TaxID=1983395 RepID=UPI003B289FDB
MRDRLKTYREEAQCFLERVKKNQRNQYDRKALQCDFILLAPNEPVVAIAGEDVVLDCELLPPTSASNMAVQWLKSGLSSPVHVYRHGQGNLLAQHQDYRGRTELFKDEITKGNVSLRIKNVRPDDEGQYTCSVEDRTDFKQSAVELHVRRKMLVVYTFWFGKMPGKFLSATRLCLRTSGLSPVTLDVETANPWLKVSEDRKSVRWTGTRRNLPDTGKRFTYWFCVLGSEGFTSGRHYWEVEVTGNQWWRLGIAAESVERKGGVTPRPETGFWIIRRFDDEMWVLTSPASRLPAGPIPDRVGVYLSYESGTVSFYNAETKSHLHTFAGYKFTEKLYPFFWTGYKNQWLRICSGSAPGLTGYQQQAAILRRETNLWAARHLRPLVKSGHPSLGANPEALQSCVRLKSRISDLSKMSFTRIQRSPGSSPGVLLAPDQPFSSRSSYVNLLSQPWFRQSSRCGNCACEYARVS